MYLRNMCTTILALCVLMNSACVVSADLNQDMKDLAYIGGLGAVAVQELDLGEVAEVAVEAMEVKEVAVGP